MYNNLIFVLFQSLAQFCLGYLVDLKWIICRGLNGLVRSIIYNFSCDINIRDREYRQKEAKLAQSFLYASPTSLNSHRDDH